MIPAEPVNRGFTLVEVMVALAIVAVALPALLFTLDQQIDGTGYIRDKSLAQLVANNKLAEVRMLAAAQGSVLAGSEGGATELAGRDWYWQVVNSSTDVPDFMRVAISVSADEEPEAPSLVTLVAYLLVPSEAPREVPGAS